jgi:hypothetical protein
MEEDEVGEKNHLTQFSYIISLLSYRAFFLDRIRFGLTSFDQQIL